MSEDNPLALPHPSVLDALYNKSCTVGEQVGTITGEFSDRIRAQYDANPDFNPPGWALYKRIRDKADRNELAARDMIRQARGILDLAEQAISKNGHVGDIADLAQQAGKAEAAPAEPEAKPSNVMPLDEARKAFEANADKAPKAGRKSSKKAQAEPEEGTALAGLKETVAEGDAHIKSLLDDDKAEEPEPAPKRSPLADAEGQGSYKIG